MLIATASIIFYLTAALYQALQLSKKVGQNPLLVVIKGPAVAKSGKHPSSGLVIEKAQNGKTQEFFEKVENFERSFTPREWRFPT